MNCKSNEYFNQIILELQLVIIWKPIKSYNK